LDEAFKKPLNSTTANHNKQKPVGLVLCSCRGASTENFAKRLSYLQKKTVHVAVLENIAQSLDMWGKKSFLEENGVAQNQFPSVNKSVIESNTD
jgi:hypothetical protein